MKIKYMIYKNYEYNKIIKFILLLFIFNFIQRENKKKKEIKWY